MRVHKLTFASASPRNQNLSLKGPPPAYDHRKQLKTITRDLIRTKYPDLEPLVENGTVIAIPRSEAYVERRTDGYVEPELILLIGTAHLSQQSADDVTKVIQLTKPDNVVVELCRSRTPLLYQQTTEQRSQKASNLMALGGSDGLFPTLARTLRLGGQSSLILRLLLGNISSKLSQKVGLEQTGVEFRAAKTAADSAHSELVLGDRPIEITLRRAWDALSWSARWQLVRDLITGLREAESNASNTINANATVGQDDMAELLDKLNNDDAVSSMLRLLADRYPEAVSPLVHERDLYLAWSLSRSKAVNGAKTVVGVVGRGHLRGVCYALTHGSGGKLRFRDLAGSKSGSETAVAVVRRLVLETVAVGGVYLAWTEAASRHWHL